MSRYRVDCTNCGWHGYRTPEADACACYDEWAWYCTPTSPGPGCMNGANLHRPCPRCENLRITVERNEFVLYRDRGRINVRPVQRREAAHV